MESGESMVTEKFPNNSHTHSLSLSLSPLAALSVFLRRFSCLSPPLYFSLWFPFDLLSNKHDPKGHVIDNNGSNVYFALHFRSSARETWGEKNKQTDSAMSVFKRSRGQCHKQKWRRRVQLLDGARQTGRKKNTRRQTNRSAVYQQQKTRSNVSLNRWKKRTIKIFDYIIKCSLISSPWKDVL